MYSRFPNVGMYSTSLKLHPHWMSLLTVFKAPLKTVDEYRKCNVVDKVDKELISTWSNVVFFCWFLTIVLVECLGTHLSITPKIFCYSASRPAGWDGSACSTEGMGLKVVCPKMGHVTQTFPWGHCEHMQGDVPRNPPPNSYNKALVLLFVSFVKFLFPFAS